MILVIFSQTQNHLFLEFQATKALQTLHGGVLILAFSFKVIPT